MAWYDEFGGTFWLTLAGALFGFLALIVRASLKSNCKNFSCCCGLFKCVRDTTVDPDDLELATTATNR